jgi:hypothetical protein
MQQESQLGLLSFNFQVLFLKLSKSILRTFQGYE